MRIRKSTLLFILLLPLLIYISYFIIGNMNKQFLLLGPDGYNQGVVADSYYYYHASNLYRSILLEALAGNTSLDNLQPILLIYLFDYNLDLLYFFYLSAFCVALLTLIPYVKHNQMLLMLFLMFNPTLLGSLYGPNKEITSLIAVMFFLTFILSLRKRYFILALIMALISRIELLALFIFFGWCLKKKISHSKLMVIIFLLVLSAVAALFSYKLSFFVLTNNATASSLGLTKFLASLDQYGLYFLTMPFKVLINAYGDIMKNVFTDNLFGKLMHATSYLLLLFNLIALWKNRLSLRYEVFSFIVLYSAIFCMAAFIQFRYLTPLYPMMAYLALSSLPVSHKANQ